MLLNLTAAMATLFLSYLFATGGWQKLAQPRHLRQAIDDYRITPPGWSATLSRVLPVAELVTGLALLAPATRSWALASALALLLLYSLAMAINLVRGRSDLDCGCAGPGQTQTVSSALLWRNAALVALALHGLGFANQPPSGAASWGLILFGAALAALCYHTANQLIANHQLLRRIARHG